MFYQKTKHCKYDWAAIFGFISPFQDREDRYICSEWCIEYSKIAQQKVFYNISSYKTSPNRAFEILMKNKTKNT